ncbi:hypothetical protein JXD38_11525 [candidate division WOR-3 bacterium]|nr:hypothetical protein [candidate division WOR-3 bacterium]
MLGRAVSAIHALRLDPEYVHARLHAAILLSNKGDQRGGIQHLRVARELVPDPEIVLNDLAIAFSAAGETDSALATIDQATRCAPWRTATRRSGSTRRICRRSTTSRRFQQREVTLP